MLRFGTIINIKSNKKICEDIYQLIEFLFFLYTFLQILQILNWFNLAKLFNSWSLFYCLIKLTAAIWTNLLSLHLQGQQGQHTLLKFWKYKEVERT